MKTKCLLAAMAIILLACQPTKEKEELTEIQYSSALDISPPACAAPPNLETVKFLPPVIKDDAVEENTSTDTKESTVTKNKKIIKDGYISIKVKDVEASKNRIDAIVKSYNAYYENECFENNDFKVSYSLKIRVPANKFESFLKANEKAEGEIVNKNINARDVTEEFVDGEIRLNSKKLFRNRYNQLLEKAGKVDDILAIEENIRTLQEEIESQEGQLKFLGDQVTYSTLDIELFHNNAFVKPINEDDTFFNRFKTSLSKGWDMVVTFALWCITQWPWYILIILIIMIVKMYLKKRRNKIQKD
ncbi:MAG: DUF4349 domain-containing protein [Bacteroidota bacterium]